MAELEYNPVLKSVKRLSESDGYVAIRKDGIREFARSFRAEDLNPWTSASPVGLPKQMEEKLAFLFVFNSISFCYWGDPKWKAHPVNAELDRGTWNMISALRGATGKGFDVLDPKSLKDMTTEGLGAILEGNVEIPLLAERCRILREIGTSLERDFDGDFLNVLRIAGGDAIKLLRIVVAHFPSFHDSSILDGEEVFFFKRAQLLVSDISRQFPGGLGRADELTACADYVLPMVLRWKGILGYSRGLAEAIDSRAIIQRGSREEICIRASTILAVEMIKEELRARIPGICSMDVNDYLWLAKKEVPTGTAYHLTRTTAY
ncbi:MAG: queuosine salvage family protein [Candidatus Micrarchaeota archaeon]